MPLLDSTGSGELPCLNVVVLADPLTEYPSDSGLSKRKEMNPTSPRSPGRESSTPSRSVALTPYSYFNKAIVWARKYGLRILLDFHGLPGSQNPWNHSGKGGMTNWMYGVMGLANAQRSLEQMRSMTEYLSQPGIREVVPM